MMKFGIPQVIAACGIAVGVAMGGVVVARQAEAQTDQPLVRVVVPEGARVGDKDVAVRVEVENVRNLGAFEFQLKYDPDILQVLNDAATDKPMIQRGDFLGSSGREVVCDDPVSQAGVLRVVCITLRVDPPGPDGAGTLATVNFEAIGKGASELSLDRVQLTDPAAAIFSDIQLQAATLEVTGKSSFNWAIWGPVIGVIAALVIGGGGFAATRMRGAKPA